MIRLTKTKRYTYSHADSVPKIRNLGFLPEALVNAAFKIALFVKIPDSTSMLNLGKAKYKRHKRKR